jgi:hypothetical protein
VIAMILLSPVTWDHAGLLLLVPLALVWLWLPPSLPARALFVAIIMILWFYFPWLWKLVGLLLPQGTAGPFQLLTVVALPCYALLALFALLALVPGPAPAPAGNAADHVQTEEPG